MRKESAPVPAPEILKDKPETVTETPLPEFFDQKSLETAAPEIEKILSNLEANKPSAEKLKGQNVQAFEAGVEHLASTAMPGKGRQQWEVDRDNKMTKEYAEWSRNVLIVLGTALTGINVLNGTLALSAAAIGISLGGYALLALIAYYGVKAVGDFINSRKK